ncbi:MAG TPA: hypothetical protein VNQ81_08920, partial [Povalibacter sp.]|nr:hypothetical protein [Povalibacter sp.]
VDGHIHLDKSFVGDRWRPHVPADSLRARLAAEKPLLSEALPITERADALIAQAHAFGTIAMRSHVDVDATTGLTNLHAVMAMLIGYRCGFHTDEELNVALEMASTAAAQALDLTQYGIGIGQDATFVVLDAPNAAAAVAAPPQERIVVQHGEFVRHCGLSPLRKLLAH